MNESNTEEKKVSRPSNDTPIVSKDIMLEAGVYFGHRKAQWDPKMKPYILTTRKGTHIIDILKTKKALEFAFNFIKKSAENNASFIFVGTRRQAKATIKENAVRTNSHYVNERWLGGTLTNGRTIFERVKRMVRLEKLQENDFEGYTKKEGVLYSKELAKLQKNLHGIRNMQRKPNVMIVADPKNDIIAIKEAKKLGIKVVGVVDTNVNPGLVDIAIPGNDDSVKSLTLLLTILADAIANAKGSEMQYAFKQAGEIKLPDELPSLHKKRQWGNRSNIRTRKPFIPKKSSDGAGTVTVKPANAKPVEEKKVQTTPVTEVAQQLPADKPATVETKDEEKGAE